MTTLVNNENEIEKIPEEKIEEKGKKKEEWKGTGKIDYKEDFFGKKCSLTVSG